VLGSTLALLWWVREFKPDVQDLVARVAGLERGWLIWVGVAGVVVNAACEELAYRGVIWRGIEQVVRSGGAVLVVQAAVFGLSHYRGFPRGVSGMLLAAAYGLALGGIRVRTDGLLLPASCT